MTAVLPRRSSPAILGQPSAKVPGRIGEHRPDESWHCQWCPFEPWPCPTLQRQALAYFWRNPADLWKFMSGWLEHARAHPEFAQAATAALQRRFLGWIEPALRAQRRLEQARAAVTTGAQRAVTLIPEWFRSLRETLLDTGDGIRVGRHRDKARGR